MRHAGGLLRSPRKSKQLVKHWARFLREKYHWTDPLFSLPEKWEQMKSSPVTPYSLQQWQTKKDIILFWKPIIHSNGTGGGGRKTNRGITVFFVPPPPPRGGMARKKIFTPMCKKTLIFFQRAPQGPPLGCLFILCKCSLHNALSSPNIPHFAGINLVALHIPAGPKFNHHKARVPAAGPQELGVKLVKMTFRFF